MMSTLFDSSTKLTVNIALKRLIFYGIALGLLSQIMSVIISFITGSGRLSYDSLTCGLGLALGCSMALLLDGKITDRIRVVIAVMLSLVAMGVFTFVVH